MKKRILVLSLITALILSMFSVSATSVLQPTFVISSVETAAGETVDITVGVQNNPGIASIRVKVAYDEALTLHSVAYNTAIGGMSMPPQHLTSPVTLNWFNGVANSTGDWTLATLSFTVANNAEPGEHPITLTYEADNVYDIMEQNITFAITDGGVTVRCLHTVKTEIPAQSANCEQAGNNKYYTCACGKVFKADGVTQTTVAAETLLALGHDWSSASCLTPSTCKRIGCGATNGDPLGHSWTEKLEDEAHVKQAAENCTQHTDYWYDCARCDAISDTSFYTSTTTGDHAYTEKIADTAHLVAGSGEDCQSVKQYYYDCQYCDRMGTAVWSSTVIGSHKMATGWTTENGYHFHACTVTGCDHREDKAACSGGTASCTEKAKCSVCNAPYGDYAKHQYSATWNQGDASGHWHDCQKCSAHDTPVAHTPNIPAATEESAQSCTQCGYVIAPKLNHVHKTTRVSGNDADCTTPGQKAYYTCACGKWFEDAAAGQEITDKGIVNVPALGHDMAAATCTAPSTCRRQSCGYTEGTALGHSWTEKEEDAVHLKTQGLNCTEYDIYWYNCSRCEEISDTEFYTGNTVGTHDYTKKVEDISHLAKNADCQNTAAYYYGCQHCDSVSTETWNSKEFGDHKVSENWETAEGKHYHACQVSGCDYKVDEAVCNGGVVTCLQKAECQVCKQPYGELLAHVASDWLSNDKEHWKLCDNVGCGQEIEESRDTHADADHDNRCDQCGYVLPAKDAANPATGDNSMVILWSILLILCVGLAVTLAKIQKVRAV